MRLYRVTWADPTRWSRLPQHRAGHPLFVPLDQQGRGRFDNPGRYAALYLARSPEAAVGETYGAWPVWSGSMFGRPKDALVRVLATVELPDDAPLTDLDDAGTLLDLGLKPSDVVRRNPDLTQEIALKLWVGRAGTQTHGLCWWSYWRVEWRLAMLWSDGLASDEWFPHLSVEDLVPLTVDHDAVQVAAEVLPRHLDRTG
jgi:hypothetical protein